MNVHGTRSIQTLLDVLSKRPSLLEDQLYKISSQLKKQIKELSLVKIYNYLKY